MTTATARRILIVEDSAVVRASLESFLEPYGFEVEHAEDGAAGLRRCTEARYDLLLLDLHMPVLDGPSMLRLLRQRGDRTPVVLVTSASDTKLLASTIKLGRADYVCKPFDLRQIHAALSRGLGVPPELLVADAPRALVVDAGEVTGRLLRGAVPPHVEVDLAATAEAVEALGRGRRYRLVLVDGVSWAPDAAEALGRHLKALHPEAALFLLDDPERTSDGRRRIPTGPFDGVLPRPPEARVVREFLYPACLRAMVTASGVSVALSAYRGYEEDQVTWFAVAARRLVAAVRETLRSATGLEVDLSRAPEAPEQVGELIAAVLRDTPALQVDPEFLVSAATRAALTAGGRAWAAPLRVPGP